MTALAAFDAGALSLSSLPSSYWDAFASEEHSSLVAWAMIFVLPTLLLRLDHWQRIVAARDEHTVRRAYVLSALTLPFVFGSFLFVGMTATSAGSTAPFPPLY